MPTTAKRYSGQCHCGSVHFTVLTDLGSMGDCNCSRCRRLNWVMQSVPAGDFVLKGGADNLTLFQFNTGTIAHMFCKTCGIEPFARGSDGQGQDLVMINVSCLEDAPAIDRANIKHWDGANW